MEYANNFLHEKKPMEVKTCLELNGNDEDDEINNAAEQMIGNSEF